MNQSIPKKLYYTLTYDWTVLHACGLITWVETLIKACFPFVDRINDMIGWDSWTLQEKYVHQ